MPHIFSQVWNSETSFGELARMTGIYFLPAQFWPVKSGKIIRVCTNCPTTSATEKLYKHAKLGRLFRTLYITPKGRRHGSKWLFWISLATTVAIFLQCTVFVGIRMDFMKHPKGLKLHALVLTHLSADRAISPALYYRFPSPVVPFPDRTLLVTQCTAKLANAVELYAQEHVYTKPAWQRSSLYTHDTEYCTVLVDHICTCTCINWYRKPKQRKLRKASLTMLRIGFSRNSRSTLSSTIFAAAKLHPSTFSPRLRIHSAGAKTVACDRGKVRQTGDGSCVPGLRQLSPLQYCSGKILEGRERLQQPFCHRGWRTLGNQELISPRDMGHDEALSTPSCNRPGFP